MEAMVRPLLSMLDIAIASGAKQSICRRGKTLDASSLALLTMTEGTSLRTHRLDIVAVGIEQERGVVGRAIVMAMSGRAVVAATGLQALGVKLPDRGMIRCAKGDMRAGVFQPLVQIEP